MLHVLTWALVLALVECKSLPQNNTVLISTYAKVARWGSSNNNNSSQVEATHSQGRSNSGQTLWTHRSDANVISGQHLKPSVVYHYGISKPFSKIDQDKNEPIPGKGEIEERFNPRPYFEYTHKSPQYGGDSVPPPKPSPSAGDDSKPSITYGSPFDSFPVFTKTEDSKPASDSDGGGGGGDGGGGSDLYDSPYSSYNPPSKPDDMKDDADDDNSYKFPPLAPPPSGNYKDADVYQSPPEDTGAKKKPMPSIYDMSPVNGYLPPPEPSMNVDPPLQYEDYPYKPTVKPSKSPAMNDEDDHPAPSPPPPMHGDAFPGPYSYLPSYDSDPEPEQGQPPASSYLPSHDHMNGDGNPGPPISYTVAPPSDAHSSYLEHPPQGYDDHHFHHHIPAAAPAPPPPPPMPAQPPMPTNMGPPADDSPTGGYGQIPQYLDHDPKGHGYDFYGYDHHPPVYHEVEHPTTTEMMEDQRVNKHHYSYYYLGRKLWFVPLIFSIYFIIYVTILILKSIARHKVQLKHQHHDKYRKSRNLEIDEINEIHRNVSQAIETSTQRFMFM